MEASEEDFEEEASGVVVAEVSEDLEGVRGVVEEVDLEAVFEVEEEGPVEVAMKWVEEEAAVGVTHPEALMVGEVVMAPVEEGTTA